jgi:HEAT repeat protein
MTPEHTAAIIQRLQNNNALVRAGAANALGLIRCREAVDPLMERLSQDQEASVRQSAANALGRIGEKRAEAALVKAQSDPSKEVQSAAKMSLALLRSGNLK